MTVIQIMIRALEFVGTLIVTAVFSPVILFAFLAKIVDATVEPVKTPSSVVPAPHPGSPIGSVHLNISVDPAEPAPTLFPEYSCELSGTIRE